MGREAMEEIEQMEQQPIATENVFQNVEPISTSAEVIEAAATVASLSNTTTQPELAQQTATLEVIEDNIPAVTAPAEFDPSVDPNTVGLPMSTNLQLNSNLPISANLEVTSTLTSTPASASLQMPSTGPVMAVPDLTGTPSKVEEGEHSKSFDEVKEWLIGQTAEQETVVPTTTQKLSRRRYSVDFKLLAVEYTKTHSKNETARHFKVHKKQIQEWCKHKDDLVAMKSIVDSGGKITRGQGRRSPFRSNAGLRPYSIAIDNAVRDYFIDCTKQGIKVTKRMLQEKAYELHHSRSDGNQNFTGSDGWLTKFVQRHGINLKDGTIDNPLEQVYVPESDAQINPQDSE